MAFKMESVACDPQSMEDGTEVEIYFGWKWKIRSMHSDRVKDANRKALDSIMSLSAEQQKGRGEELDLEVLATHVIADWEEAELLGEPYPFSAANALKLLKDPRFPDIVDSVRRASNKLQNFRLQTERDQKND